MTKTKNPYIEYKEKNRKQFHSLPIFFAFSREQFKKAMEERGLTENDTDKIYRLSDTGGFYLKSDAEKIHSFFNQPDNLSELMESEKGFAYSAFYYELGDHEYHINQYQGDYDVCRCFGRCEYSPDKDYKDYLKEMGYSDSVISSFEKARKDFMNYVDKNDLY